MKKTLSAVTALLILFSPSSVSVEAQEKSEPSTQLTTYYVGLLFCGPKWTPEVTPESERIQKEHLANIKKLAKSGKLILAGPFTDGGNLRGLFVFRVESPEEAQALADTDPAVKAGRLVVEMHPWLSAKGIRAGQ